MKSTARSYSKEKIPKRNPRVDDDIQEKIERSIQNSPIPEK